MGYTHYWRANKAAAPNNQQWGQIIAAAGKVFSDHADVLETNGDQAFRVDADCVYFNGIGDQSHETFILDRACGDFEFCKTAYKPYDAAVVDMLKAVKQIVPNWLNLSSDGGSEIFD